MIKRTICNHIDTVLGHWGKIALVSGPRQVGKTTVAKQILESTGQGTYFNWDIVSDQKRLVQDPLFFQHIDRDPSKPTLVVLDEIHKFAKWKNWLKGAWDGNHDDFRYIVTGSGRLDLFRKGADSLMGRAVGIPLFPLTVGELLGHFPGWNQFLDSLEGVPPAVAEGRDWYDGLMRFGGFPEPLLRAEDAFHRVWHAERMNMLIRQDIRDATRIREISMLEVLSHLIPDRIGSRISINALREDLGVAFETVRDWLLVLGHFYYLFLLSPWSKSVSRGLKKEQKAYLFDWADITHEGPRFENMVAMHLHKAVATWNATGSGEPALHYLRDKEKREVDFVLVDGDRPVCLVECKAGDVSVSKQLIHFQESLSVPVAVQLVNVAGICRRTDSSAGVVWVVSADRWLSMLP